LRRICRNVLVYLDVSKRESLAFEDKEGQRTQVRNSTLPQPSNFLVPQF
jgi:hypothetical protein